MDRRLFIALMGSALTARPVAAKALIYRLDRTASTVAFTYQMNGHPFTGRMPVLSADILLDLDNPPASRVRADIDVSGADAGPFYATEAMKSESVLDTAHYPSIRFESSSTEGTARGATVHGALTIRDITEKIALDAVIYRRRGTEEGDRKNLSILLSGNVDRRRYGASGYPAIVGPTIHLQILTRITQA